MSPVISARDLLTLQQPFFALASTDIDLSESSHLLEIVRTPQTSKQQ